jgi:thiol-disulfide isomerase/thioredoxin
MACIDLNHTSPTELQQHLAAHSTIVACLCADWCDVCKGYQPKFQDLAQSYPDILFIWIDIEDQANLVDHLEVDNFPTLLIQQNDIVGFYGAMQSDPIRLKRQIDNLLNLPLQQLQQLAESGDQQQLWQREANIRARLAG